jgi:hypothetical protein
VLLGVVKGDPLIQVGLGAGLLAKVKEVHPQSEVSLHLERRVLFALGQGKEGLCELKCLLEFCANVVKKPKPRQRGEEPRCLTYLLAQLPRPGVGLLHIRGRIALGGNQGGTEGNLQD